MKPLKRIYIIISSYGLAVVMILLMFLLTLLGTSDSQEDFVRRNLDTKIDKMFCYMDNAPTIVKRRFIELYPFQKLFELYVMGDVEPDATASGPLCAKLKDVLSQYDVVIVTDYGHGMLGREAVDMLCKRARFLALLPYTGT